MNSITKTGNLIVEASGIITSFNSQPIEIVLRINEKKNYKFIFKFLEDSSKAKTSIELNSVDVKKELEFSLVNFMSDLGSGLAEPLCFLTENSKKWYIYFSVHSIAQKNPSLQYTVYQEA